MPVPPTPDSSASHATSAPATTTSHLGALAVCLAAALLLLWPLLTGQIMFGGGRSDMFIAGYSFRLFGAEWFKETGSIPQWNPYLFGGLPYIGAMHGDIFYPSAWLRWIMPVDLAITYAMALHFVLAGWFMYRLGRSLGLGWGAAVVAGVAYELTGIVASQMSPGHDGKLFVSALTPLSFWVLLAAIRHQKRWAFGVFAITVALIILGHYHMAYFLLLALGLWALYLVFWDPQRPAEVQPLPTLALAAGAVAIGLGITALQVMPFFAYIPFSPRADGATDLGWEFATSYALPPGEVFTLLLPQFNGVLDHYWGTNPIKFHTEYMGALPLVLAAFAFGDKQRRVMAFTLAGFALFFLLLSFAGHTPFYRPFYEFMPLLKKIRAMGMVFYLPAFFLCVLAGIGAERVFARAVPMRTVLAVGGAVVLFALLGAVGALQGLAESMAINERYEAVVGNAPYLQSGAVRLLVFAVAGLAVLVGAVNGKIARPVATAMLALVVALDLWSVNREFYTFSPRATELFADDAITTRLKEVKPPYRVLDAANAYGWSLLMAYKVPTALGYHGFELQRYRELGGKDSGWQNLFSPNLLDLLAIRYLILPDSQPVPGFRQVVPKMTTTFGTPAVLYERESLPAYARVIPASAKLAKDQAAATIVDERFPVNRVAIFDDSATVLSPAAAQPFAEPTATATVTSWQPGAMEIQVTGAEAAPSHLVVSENWYKDWTAEVDGKPGVVRRADLSLLSVDLPPGAKSVRLTFASPEYATGKLVSLVSLVLALALSLVPVAMGRRRAASGGAA
jgi:hypothetical protein